MRVISAKNIGVDFGTGQSRMRRSSLFGKRKVVEPIETLVIHYHPGGFIIMSSRSCVGYVSKISKQLELPIFSVDFRNAPLHRFPCALEDAWNVYYWLVLNCEEIFGIMPKKIVLIGE